jgi:hypothetical protein
MRRLGLALLLLAALPGCTSASVVLTDPSRTYEPVGDVQILDEPPSRPYETIAIIEAKGSYLDGFPEVARSARDRAGQIGAHAIMAVADEDREGSYGGPMTAGPPVRGQLGGGRRPAYSFAAIRYLD